MRNIKEYQDRKYVKAIKIGNMIFFIGLFFGFYHIGSLISLIASIMHHFNSKKRIQLAAIKLGTVNKGI